MAISGNGIDAFLVRHTPDGETTVSAQAFERLLRRVEALEAIERAAEHLIRWYDGEDGVESLPAHIDPLARCVRWSRALHKGVVHRDPEMPEFGISRMKTLTLLAGGKST